MSAFTFPDPILRQSGYSSFHSGLHSSYALAQQSTLAHETVSVYSYTRAFAGVDTYSTRGCPLYLPARESDSSGTPFCDDSYFLASSTSTAVSNTYLLYDELTTTTSSSLSTTTVSWDDVSHSWVRSVESSGTYSSGFGTTSIITDTSSSFATSSYLDRGRGQVASRSYSYSLSQAVTYADSLAYYLDRTSTGTDSSMISYLNRKSANFNPYAGGQKESGTLEQYASAGVSRYATGVSSENLDNPEVHLVLQTVTAQSVEPADHYKDHSVYAPDGTVTTEQYSGTITTPLWGERGNHASLSAALTDEPWVEDDSLTTSMTETTTRAGFGWKVHNLSPTLRYQLTITVTAQYLDYNTYAYTTETETHTVTVDPLELDQTDSTTIALPAEDASEPLEYITARITRVQVQEPEGAYQDTTLASSPALRAFLRPETFRHVGYDATRDRAGSPTLVTTRTAQMQGDAQSACVVDISGITSSSTITHRRYTEYGLDVLDRDGADDGYNRQIHDHAITTEVSYSGGGASSSGVLSRYTGATVATSGLSFPYMRDTVTYSTPTWGASISTDELSTCGRQEISVYATGLTFRGVKIGGYAPEL